MTLNELFLARHVESARGVVLVYGEIGGDLIQKIINKPVVTKVIWYIDKKKAKLITIDVSIVSHPKLVVTHKLEDYPIDQLYVCYTYDPLDLNRFNLSDSLVAQYKPKVFGLLGQEIDIMVELKSSGKNIDTISSKEAQTIWTVGTGFSIQPIDDVYLNYCKDVEKRFVLTLKVPTKPKK